MVGASVLGVFLQGLPHDRRVAMARVASLIRRAARGVRESKRFGLVFYELNGGPLFALESREKSLTLYVAEKSVVDEMADKFKGYDPEHSLIHFNDLNRLPLPDIEKIVRASVLVRRERGTVPAQAEILELWDVKEEEAAVAPPVVRISMRTADDEAAEAAAKAEAERIALENKKILRPTKPEKSLVQKRQAAAAAAAKAGDKPARKTSRTSSRSKSASTAAKKAAKANESEPVVTIVLDAVEAKTATHTRKTTVKSTTVKKTEAKPVTAAAAAGATRRCASKAKSAAAAA